MTVRIWLVKGLFLALGIWFVVGGIGLIGEARFEHEARVAQRQKRQVERERKEEMEDHDPASWVDISEVLEAVKRAGG